MENKLLLKIANAIMINSQLTNNEGIYDGHTGHCIFLYVFARKYEMGSFETFAEYLLNDITEHLHYNQSIDFQTGLSGIAYGVYYLMRNGYVEGDPDYILGDIDEYIQKKIDNENYSISTEIEGYVSPSYYIQYRKDDRKDIHIEENCDCTDLSKLGLYGWLAFIYGMKIRLSFSNTEKDLLDKDCSLSTSLLSEILCSIMQNGLLLGQLQTVPFHLLSCQGTRIEICFIFSLLEIILIF